MTTEVAVAVAKSSLENTTYTFERSHQSTASGLVITSTSLWAGQKILLGLLLFMCSFAFIANLAMLISLLKYKQATKKAVNIFVCNQTILDLITSFVAIVKFALQISGYLKIKTGVLRLFS